MMAETTDPHGKNLTVQGRCKAVMVRILGISGSLQATSSNTALLRLARTAASTDVDLVIYNSLSDLPHFNPDLERESVPRSVSELRAQLLAADAVLIASPEYAHSLPGSLKNALDWVVGSGELYDKPVAILSASPRPNGGVYVRAALEQTLHAQGAQVVASTTVRVPARSAIETEPPDSPIRRAVSKALDALIAIIGVRQV